MSEKAVYSNERARYHSERRARLPGAGRYAARNLGRGEPLVSQQTGA